MWLLVTLQTAPAAFLLIIFLLVFKWTPFGKTGFQVWHQLILQSNLNLKSSLWAGFAFLYGQNIHEIQLQMSFTSTSISTVLATKIKDIRGSRRSSGDLQPLELILGLSSLYSFLSAGINVGNIFFQLHDGKLQLIIGKKVFLKAQEFFFIKWTHMNSNKTNENSWSMMRSSRTSGSCDEPHSALHTLLK